jgi:Dyp-type peroxidase family
LYGGSSLQEGIYHYPNDEPKSSFCALFLRIREHSTPDSIRNTLARLWEMYGVLKRTMVSDLTSLGKDTDLGVFSVLFGYGPSVFEIEGLKRSKPENLQERWLFLPSSPVGCPILPDVGLKYGDNVTANEVAKDDVIIQLIGNTQFATHRALVETLKLLNGIDGAGGSLNMRFFYTGFNRPDGRGWLGFHDGVSNIQSSNRLNVIEIDKRDLSFTDQWTAGGTYLAFLRIDIDLSLWMSKPEKLQERIVGREKSTGCPLVNVDHNDKNIFASGCPKPGTSEIVQSGNEDYRLYPSAHYSGHNGTDPESVIGQSHVGRMINADSQIFRQGFEFLEPSENYPYFHTGLNFVSFQKGTDKIYWSIRKGFEAVNFGGESVYNGEPRDRILSVNSAGLFLVPPFNRGDQFPGQVIFDDDEIGNSLEKRPFQYL